MIYTPHILIGAAIGAKTHNLGLIIILGLISHFIMDKIPHWDYPVYKYIKNFEETKSFKSLLPLILKSTIDVFIGLAIVFVAAWYKNILDFHNIIFILLGIFFSLLPDIILAPMVIWLSKDFSKKYIQFHEKYLTF